MSAFSTIFGAIGRPALLAQVGEPVVRYPLGVEPDEPEAIPGIFEELEPDRRIQFGDEINRRGRLQIAATETADPKDVWLIRSETWQVLTVESAAADMKTVHVVRRDKTATKRTSPDRIL